MATSKTGLDPQTAMHLRDGFTIPQLAEAYQMDPKEVRQRLARVPVSTVRGNSNCYRLRDIAPVMWTPTVQQMDEAIKRMPHAQLPKLLSKEYWQGLRSRQEWQLREGELWPTALVVERVGELFKVIKQNLTLLTDTIERQTELTDRQRAIVRDACDATLRGLSDEINEKFAPGPDDDDHNWHDTEAADGSGEGERVGEVQPDDIEARAARYADL